MVSPDATVDSRRDFYLITWPKCERTKEESDAESAERTGGARCRVVVSSLVAMGFVS
jgi:hypothetical protein